MFIPHGQTQLVMSK